MEAQPCVRGEFYVNDAASTLFMSAASGASGNTVAGAYTASKVTDSGTANSWNINAGLATPVQHVTGRFQVRYGDTGSGIPITATNYVLDIDHNAGTPQIRMLGTSSNYFDLNGAALRLTTAGAYQIVAGGTVTQTIAGSMVLTTTTGAFFPPQLTTTQRDALTPLAGMMI
jgi:hypothetical protein